MPTLTELERQKAAALGRVAGWSSERLAYRPAPNTWSATEVFDHLVRVEHNILDAARHGVHAPHPVGVRDRLGFRFLDWLFRSDRQVRVPRSAAHVLPDARVELTAVRERWDATREELAAFLAELTPDQYRTGVFRHPVSGWMTVPDILRFFSVHLQHHGAQLTRLAAASEGR